MASSLYSTAIWSPDPFPHCDHYSLQGKIGNRNCKASKARSEELRKLKKWDGTKRRPKTHVFHLWAKEIFPQQSTISKYIIRLADLKKRLIKEV